MQVEFDDFSNFKDEEYLKRISFYHLIHVVSITYNSFEEIIKNSYIGNEIYKNLGYKSKEPKEIIDLILKFLENYK